MAVHRQSRHRSGRVRLPAHRPAATAALRGSGHHCGKPRRHRGVRIVADALGADRTRVGGGHGRRARSRAARLIGGRCGRCPCRAEVRARPGGRASGDRSWRASCGPAPCQPQDARARRSGRSRLRRPGGLRQDPARVRAASAHQVASRLRARGGRDHLVHAVRVGAGETIPPALVGVLLLDDTTRPGRAGVAVAGFVLALVSAIALARFGAAGGHDGPQAELGPRAGQAGPPGPPGSPAARAQSGLPSRPNTG